MSETPAIRPKDKVICLGMPRTGTTSLYQAFQILGYTKAYHMYTFSSSQDPEVYEMWARFYEGPKTPENLRAIMDPYEAIFDWPGSHYPDLLVAAYPHAKFILNTRDPEAWEASFRSSVLSAAKAALATTPEMENEIHPMLKSRFRFHRSAWWCTEYEQLPSKEELLERIHRHNEHVRQIVPASQLFEYSVGKDGWDKLCKFMECDVPDVPFPHLNSTAAYWKHGDNLGFGEKPV